MLEADKISDAEEEKGLERAILKINSELDVLGDDYVDARSILYAKLDKLRLRLFRLRAERGG